MAELPVGVNVSCAIVGGDVTLNDPVILEFSVGNRLPETIVVDFGGQRPRIPHQYDPARWQRRRAGESQHGRRGYAAQAAWTSFTALVKLASGSASGWYSMPMYPAYPVLRMAWYTLG